MAEIHLKSTIQFRRGTKEEWETINPILRAGEPGVAVDTQEYKIGDGVTRWNDLPAPEGGLEILQGAGAPSDEIEATVGQTYYDTADSTFYFRKEGSENVWEKMVNQQDLDNIDIPNVGVGQPTIFYKNDTLENLNITDVVTCDNYIFVTILNESNNTEYYFSKNGGVNFSPLGKPYSDITYTDFSDIRVFSFKSQYNDSKTIIFYALSQHKDKPPAILSVRLTNSGYPELFLIKLEEQNASLSKMNAVSSWENQVYVQAFSEDSDVSTTVYQTYFHATGLVDISASSWTKLEVDFPNASLIDNYTAGSFYLYPKTIGNKYAKYQYGSFNAVQNFPASEKWNFPELFSNNYGKSIITTVGWKDGQEYASNKVGILTDNQVDSELKTLPMPGSFGKAVSCYYSYKNEQSQTAYKEMVFLPPCYEDALVDTKSTSTDTIFATNDYGDTFSTYILPKNQKWLKPIYRFYYVSTTYLNDFRLIILPEEGDTGVYFKNKEDGSVEGPITITLPVSQKWSQPIQIQDKYFLLPWHAAIDDNVTKDNIDIYAKKSRYMLYSSDGISWEKLELPREDYWNDLKINADGNIYAITPIIGDKMYFSLNKGINWSETAKFSESIIKHIESYGKYDWYMFKRALKNEFSYINYIGATTSDISSDLIAKHNSYYSGAHTNKADLENGEIASRQLPNYLTALKTVKINGQFLSSGSQNLTSTTIPAYNSVFANSEVNNQVLSNMRTILIGSDPLNGDGAWWSVPIKCGNYLFSFGDNGKMAKSSISKKYNFEIIEPYNEEEQEIYKSLSSLIIENPVFTIKPVENYANNKAYWCICKGKTNHYLMTGRQYSYGEILFSSLLLPVENIRETAAIYTGTGNSREIIIGATYTLENSYRNNTVTQKFIQQYFDQTYGPNGAQPKPIGEFTFNTGWVEYSYRQYIRWDKSNNLIVCTVAVNGTELSGVGLQKMKFFYSTDGGNSWNSYAYDVNIPEGYRDTSSFCATYSPEYVDGSYEGISRYFQRGIDVLKKEFYSLSGELKSEYIQFIDGTWKQVENPFEVIGEVKTTVDGEFYYSKNDKLYYSKEGLTFSEVILPEGTWNTEKTYTVEKNDGQDTVLWIITGKYATNKMIVSEDKGETWREITLPFTAIWTGLVALENSHRIFLQSNSSYNPDNIGYVLLTTYSYTDLTNWIRVKNATYSATTASYDKNDNVYGARFVDYGRSFQYNPAVINSFVTYNYSIGYLDYQNDYQEDKIQVYVKEYNALNSSSSTSCYMDPYNNCMTFRNNDQNNKRTYFTTEIPIEYFNIENNYVQQSATINGKPIGDSVELTVSDIPGVAPILNTVTLGSSLWSSDEPFIQSVSFDGILTDETRQVITVTASPEKSNIDSIIESGTYCTAQAENSLTFTAFNKKPETDQVFNISVQNV